MKSVAACWFALALLVGGCSDGQLPVDRFSRALTDDAGDDGGDDGGLAGGAVVISQIYGAGGGTGASYHYDYVELFNRGDAPVAIGGWSVQYGSSTSSISLQVNIPGGTVLAAGHYFLVQLGSGGSKGANLPSPDVIGAGAGAFNISGADGKVALVNTIETLGCGGSSRCSSPSIVDLVGYGEGTDYEGSAAPSPVGATGAIFRQGGGCIDSDNNASDFVSATAAPRNSGSPAHSCEGAANFDLSPPQDLSTPADLTGRDLSGQPFMGAPIVISQIYGAGGVSGASYRNDFVELFNRSGDSVEIGGWSLQYASKDNTFALKVDVPDPTSIPAGSYYLIRLSGGSTGMAVLEPDLTVSSQSVLNMSAGDGKVALVDHGTLLNCGPINKRCAPGTTQDLVGYGDASDYEGAPVLAGTVAQSLFRRGGGCIDSDHNDADFELAAASPRNSASPINPCATLVLDGSVLDSDGGADLDASAGVDAATRRDLAVASGDMEQTVVLTRDLGVPGTSNAHGCGCQVGGASSPSSAGGALACLAVALGWLARKRRRRVSR